MPVVQSATCLDAMVCTGCCSTLDHILAYLFKKLSNTTRPVSPSQSTPFLRILDLHPEILQQMLSSVMNIIMFENCRNQWSMSRPLLGLILLNEKVQLGGREGGRRVESGRKREMFGELPIVYYLFTSDYTRFYLLACMLCCNAVTLE